MTEEIKNENAAADTAQEARREFVKTAAKVAIAAPAVAILLSASTKPASAVTVIPYQNPTGIGID